MLFATEERQVLNYFKTPHGVDLVASKTTLALLFSVLIAGENLIVPLSPSYVWHMFKWVDENRIICYFHLKEFQTLFWTVEQPPSKSGS